MRAVVVVASVAALFLTVCPESAASGSWGAVAYDGQGNAGSSRNYPDPSSAKGAAEHSCGARCGAKPFRHCGAVAFTRQSNRGRHGYGVAAGRTGSEAREKARAACESASLKACYVKLSECNG